MKHKHAELMALYAQDAMETETPWEMWQGRSALGWIDLTTHPGWFSDSEYRRRPRMVIINGFEVPEPLREAPEDGTVYWITRLAGDPTRWTWDGGAVDTEWINAGLIHLTREAAEIHAKALLSFTRKGDGQP